MTSEGKYPSSFAGSWGSEVRHSAGSTTYPINSTSPDYSEVSARLAAEKEGYLSSDTTLSF